MFSAFNEKAALFSSPPSSFSRSFLRLVSIAVELLGMLDWISGSYSCPSSSPALVFSCCFSRDATFHRLYPSYPHSVFITAPLRKNHPFLLSLCALSIRSLSSSQCGDPLLLLPPFPLPCPNLYLFIKLPSVSLYRAAEEERRRMTEIERASNQQESKDDKRVLLGVRKGKVKQLQENDCSNKQQIYERLMAAWEYKGQKGNLSLYASGCPDSWP